MARLTESQRRRMRSESARRKRWNLAPYTNQEMATYLGVNYNEHTWATDSGGYDGSTGACGGSDPGSSSYDSGSSDSGSSFSCGGGF